MAQTSTALTIGNTLTTCTIDISMQHSATFGHTVAGNSMTPNQDCRISLMRCAA